jgi:hypothetical protein
MHHKFAIQLFGRTPFGGVNPEEAAFSQAQIAPIATTCAITGDEKRCLP